MDSREHWVRIEGFSNYRVSSEGRVQNIRTGRILKTYSDPYRGGYPSVGLRNSYGRSYALVHRLVAFSFIGEIPDHLEVNHIDGNKENNRVDNLEIITPSENVLHGYRLGLMTNSGGLRKVPVRIVELNEEFDSITKAAERINGRPSDITAALKGRQKSVYGYTFELID